MLAFSINLFMPYKHVHVFWRWSLFRNLRAPRARVPIEPVPCRSRSNGQMQGAASTAPERTLRVREERMRSGNAADGRSWTGS
jgi:hypothetical protein